VVAGVSTGALVAFAVIAVALASFVGEWLPPDITAIGVLVVRHASSLVGHTVADALDDAGLVQVAVAALGGMVALVAPGIRPTTPATGASATS